MVRTKAYKKNPYKTKYKLVKKKKPLKKFKPKKKLLKKKKRRTTKAKPKSKIGYRAQRYNNAIVNIVSALSRKPRNAKRLAPKTPKSTTKKRHEKYVHVFGAGSMSDYVQHTTPNGTYIRSLDPSESLESTPRYPRMGPKTPYKNPNVAKKLHFTFTAEGKTKGKRTRTQPKINIRRSSTRSQKRPTDNSESEPSYKKQKRTIADEEAALNKKIDDLNRRGAINDARLTAERKNLGLDIPFAKYPPGYKTAQKKKLRSPQIARDQEYVHSEL